MSIHSDTETVFLESNKLACGNGVLNPGEECDNGSGCDATCHCNRSLGYFPDQLPSVNCMSFSFFLSLSDNTLRWIFQFNSLFLVSTGTNSTYAYFDFCLLHNESCTNCLNFNCLYCNDSNECVNTRLREECKSNLFPFLTSFKICSFFSHFDRFVVVCFVSICDV